MTSGRLKAWQIRMHWHVLAIWSQIGFTGLGERYRKVLPQYQSLANSLFVPNAISSCRQSPSYSTVQYLDLKMSDLAKSPLPRLS